MTIADLETVELKVEERVAWIVLNRPEALNAWTRQLGEEMQAALDRAAEDPEVRAIVFTGAGRAFSSGADLKTGPELTDHGKPDLLTRLRTVYNPLLLGVRTVPKPVIASASGSPPPPPWTGAS
jgi:2-(1,2-epoxy-1,2-dihydrophenyl)acetyl-CoA isomerase